MKSTPANESQTKPMFTLMTSAELQEYDCRHDWLVNDLLVQGEPGVIGGPKKALKTSIMVDLAISLGTGTPFLNKFVVPKPRRVAIFSGESGKKSLAALAKRVSRTRKVRLDKGCPVFWEFRLPRLTRGEDRKALRAALREARAEVVFIDPLYLCLCAGTRAVTASNLYEVGPVLSTVARTCLRAGATPVFVHHATKATTKQETRPMDLDDLAFAGIGEFARQWLLVNRSKPFTPGSGQHNLWMSVGGSAGHSSCWELHVDEGTGENQFWKTTVKPARLESPGDVKIRCL